MTDEDVSTPPEDMGTMDFEQFAVAWPEGMAHFEPVAAAMTYEATRLSTVLMSDLGAKLAFLHARRGRWDGRDQVEFDRQRAGFQETWSAILEGFKWQVMSQATRSFEMAWQASAAAGQQEDETHDYAGAGAPYPG